MSPHAFDIDNRSTAGQKYFQAFQSHFSAAFKESVYMIGIIALTSFAGYAIFSLPLRPMFLTASMLLISQTIVKMAFPSLHASQDGFLAWKRDFELRHPNLPIAAILVQAAITLMSAPLGTVTGCFIGTYLGASALINDGLIDVSEGNYTHNQEDLF